jgi:hypothetical protein
MRRAKRSRAQIISEDILAECPFESISPACLNRMISVSADAHIASEDWAKWFPTRIPKSDLLTWPLSTGKLGLAARASPPQWRSL